MNLRREHLIAGARSVRPIASAATKRAAALSEVPTFGEAGYPALVREINAVLGKLLATKAVAEKFAALGADVMTTPRRSSF